MFDTSDERLRNAASLEELADRVDENRELVIGILTKISTRRAAEYEVSAAVRTLRGARAEVARTRPPQVGNVAVFLPSNVIFYSYVLYALVPTLFAQRVVIRPSSHVRQAVEQLHALLVPIHRLDVEVRDDTQREFLAGPVRQADVVVFAGTYQNAEKIRENMQASQVFFFLGSGINPIVVTANAAIDRAVEEIVDIRMLNSGQDCLGPDAIWVHRSVAEQFSAALCAEIERRRFGCYSDPETEYGSLHYPGVVRDIAQFFDKHQNHIRFGGKIDFSARHVYPTVVWWESPSDMDILEFFSPVFNVCVYDDDDAAAAALVSGVYAERAMGATLYGASEVLQQELIKWMTLTIDTTLLSIDDGNMPLGGRGPMANYIAVGGRIHAEPILLSQGLADHAIAGGEETQ